MIAALVLIAFVAGVLLIAWATRNAERRPRCCDPGPWPPDDITSRDR